MMHKTGRGPPMTAAERQRRCRAKGKGRHRGGLSAASRAAARQRFFAEYEAATLAQLNGTPPADPPSPHADWGISAMAA